MGGIAGLFHLNASPVNEKLLQQMIAVAGRRRGSDKVGNLVDAPIGMGHCQFYTTEESYWEQQPLSDESGQSCIVCDGRVDNREELIAQLAINDKDRIITDPELILAAYKKWGFDCPNQIVGDFAFAIWDKKQQRLFCARDYAGVRPLFYVLVDQTFIFGSTIEQFYQHPLLSAQLDDEYMANFLISQVTGPLNTPGTAIKHIRRLPPACYLWANRNEISPPIEYWNTMDIKEVQCSNPTDSAEGFRELFRSAVKCNIRNKGPVASELSGGLDSSSIVSMAADLYQNGEVPSNGFIALSKGFNSFSEADETKYQQAVIEKYNLISRRIPTDDRLFMQNTESGLCPDEPYGVFLTYDEQHVTPVAAKEFGATVLLTGIGGDEFLQGYPLYLADLLWSGKLKTFSTEVKKWSRTRNMSHLYALAEFGIKPKVPQFLHSFLGTLLRRSPEFWYSFDEFTGLAIPEWIDKRFAQDMALTERIRDLTPDKNCQKASMILEYRALRDSTSVQGVQVVCAPLSVEIRQPYFDKRLVEYVMGLPMPYKVTVGEDGTLIRKLLIRNGLKGILPECIRTRRGEPDFGRHALAGLQVALPKLLMQLDQDNIEVVRRGYVDGKIFREVLSQWMLGYWERLGGMVNTLSLELWLKRHKNEYNV